MTCFERFSDTFSPKIIGELNGQYVLAVHLEGDKVPWHTHDHEDEMFYVIDGELDIFEEDRQISLTANEFYIVPKGIRHRVVPKGHVKLLLFGPKEIKHTGSIDSEITKKKFDPLPR